MQRGTIVALAILVVLAVVYFATSSTTRQTERAPFTVEKVENLDKIRIEPLGDGGGGQKADAGSDSESDSANKPEETVVLEKRDGEWWLAKPVESPAASDVSSKIEELFGQEIGTDALEIGSDQAAKGVGSQSGVQLSLFGGGASEPAVALVVGNETTIEATNAKRTFIREPDSSEIYRAQAALGSFVRKSVDEFRSDKVVEVDRKKLSRLEWKRSDGTTIVLEKKEKSWKLLQPQVDWDLDEGAVRSITSALSGLTADGFADDRSASKVGLDSPVARLSYEAGETSGTILVGKVEGDEEATYYAKLADKPFQYEISSYAGGKLDATLGDLRSKNPRSFDKKAMMEVQFPGEDRVVVRKEEGSWTLVRPEPEGEDDFNAEKLDPKLSTLAELTVEGFPDIDPADAGLTAGADRVEFEMEGGDRYTLLIGDKVSEESSSRYVKFGDGDEVYTISKNTVDDLRPAVGDLTGEAKAPGPGKGMGKMGGKMGGKMKRLKKMQMMRKLKQQMRRKGR